MMVEKKEHPEPPVKCQSKTAWNRGPGDEGLGPS